MNYLGVILDPKLSWKDNVIEIDIGALCLQKSFEFRPTITRWLYTAVVEPVLLYGVHVW